MAGGRFERPGHLRAVAVRRAILAGMAGAALLASALARADALDDIRHRGTVVVGVKKDVPLWGQLDPTGQLVGLEPDLAADVASRMGVSLELVGLSSAERLQAIERRQVDVLIATLSDTPERRERMTMVMPHYYASGVNVLARKQAAFRQWTDLRNRRVCGRRGAFYNRQVTVEAGLDIVALYSNNLSLAALRDGRCDALLYDDTNIVAMLQDPSWSPEFEMPLPTLHVTPWALGLRKSEAGGRLEALLSRIVIDWHRKGTIVQLEHKWGIPVSALPQRMQKAWGSKRKGSWVCGDALAPDTPKECL